MSRKNTEMRSKITGKPTGIRIEVPKNTGTRSKITEKPPE